MRRIVIIGSGFAGIHIAQQLAHEVSSRRGLDLTVVTDRAHFLFTPLWAGVASGSSALPQVALPVESLLGDDARVAIDEVTGIDAQSREVVGGSGRYKYDFLVIATGAVPNWGGRPEFEHHALPCRTGRDAVDAHEALNRAFEAAALATDPAERRRLLTFVFVGAGPTGVELVSRVASRIELEMGAQLDAELAAMARLILIDRHDCVLPNLNPELGPIAHEHLRNAGVEVRLGEAVIGCSAERVELSSHDAIGCGTIFWCGGVTPPAWLRETGFQTDASGRVVVHRSLQAVGQHGVYVAGDSAGTGDSVPMTADVAVQQADVVAKNIIADLSGRSRREWTYEPGGTFVSLGRANAVVNYRGVVLQGRPAQALWGAMSSRLLPAGIRGLSLVPDLFAGAFATRRPSPTGLLSE